MKLTQILFKQHLERMARKNWLYSGKKIIAQTKAVENLEERGYKVVDGVETFVKTPLQRVELDMNLLLHWHVPKDEAHPDYKTEPCYTYGDKNVLLAGVQQAQILTNTILVKEPLPPALSKLEEEVKIPGAIHTELQKKTLLSCVFDAEQKKLPKRKDPLRPAWNFPRDYGITDSRKNTLLCQHLAATVEQLRASRDLTCVHDANFSFPINAHGKQLKFDLTAELLFTSRSMLPSYGPPKLISPLPEIHPMHCTISIEKEHFYDLQDFYPVDGSSSWPHVHTALLHYNPTQVRNLYDSQVTVDQIASRLLIKAFCLAACEARALQQGAVENPITVQVVQTDGQNFQFGVFQLNTLDLEDNNGPRNIFWLTPTVSLYSQCGYINGKPVLEGYNPVVLNRLLAFVSNC